MKFAFSSPESFTRETLLTIAGASAGGALGALLPFPGAMAAPALALTGGSLALGSAISSEKKKKWLKYTAIGAWTAFSVLPVFSALVLLGPTSLATIALAGFAGAMIAAQPGVKRSRLSLALGVAGGFVAGALGLAGYDKLLLLMPTYGSGLFSTALLGGAAYGLWLSAGQGLGHFDEAKHPLLSQADALRKQLPPHMRQTLEESVLIFEDVEAQSEKGNLPAAMAAEAQGAASGLLEGLIQMMKTWLGLTDALAAQQIRTLDKKRAELAEKAAATDDPVARDHLNRAAKALEAQGRAAIGLKKGQARSEAMVDAQAALMGRLHLTVLRQKASESDLLAHEIGDVSEEAAILFDEVDEMAATLEEMNRFGGASGFAQEDKEKERDDESAITTPETRPEMLLPQKRMTITAVEAHVIEEDIPG